MSESFNNLSREERERMAKGRGTPPDILAVLAKDKDLEIRLEVARNPHTPPEVLAVLAQDVSREVREEIAKRKGGAEND